MWWARTATTFRGWFAVQRQGVLVTGLVPGDFTFTVLSPDNAASTVVSVTESLKGGLYFADVANSFFAANGAGDYGVVVEVSAGPPPIDAVASRTMYVSAQDIDTIVSDTTTGVTGQGLTASQSTMLLELYELMGLDPTKPLVVTSTTRKVPADGTSIDQTMTDDAGTVTVQRV